MIIDGNAIDPVPKVTGRAKTRPVGEPVRDESAEQKMQQAFGGSAARPAIPVEHAMEIGVQLRTDRHDIERPLDQEGHTQHHEIEVDHNPRQHGTSLLAEVRSAALPHSSRLVD